VAFPVPSVFSGSTQPITHRTTVPAYTCQQVPVEVVRPLRHTVLRAGKPFETTIWDGDDEPDTRHFTARAGDVVIGVGTMLHRSHEVAPGPHAWQLRGMATEAAHRGRGVGAQLLLHMLDVCCAEDRGQVVWCNARSRAASFYVRHGFETVGDEFLIPEIGPHFVMRRRLMAGQAG
jgi:predicted GNAT family N-acyltransferase